MVDHPHATVLTKAESSRFLPPVWERCYVYCYVYVIKAEAGPVKIGFAWNPLKRLAGLQCAHWTELRIAAAIRCDHDGDARCVERDIHRAVKKHRLANEWFEDCPEVRKALTDAGAVWFLHG